MDISNERAPQRVISVPSLIGWLSLCLLAAAWGNRLDEQWQHTWGKVGAFGLAAALGLGSLEAARATRRRWNQVRELRSRLNNRMAKTSEQNATIESINAGIRKLQAHAREELRGLADSPRALLRSSTSLLFGMPVEVTTVTESGDEVDTGERIAGALRHISSHAVSFDHQCPFVTQVVLLDFQLTGRERLSFVVDVIWTEVNKQGNGFSSGGTVLAVGVPIIETDETPEQPALECAVSG